MTGLYECRPGGRCPDCNPAPIFCQECLENEIENPGDVCEECEAEAARRHVEDCDWCGGPKREGSRFCSRGCARAAESDHA